MAKANRWPRDLYSFIYRRLVYYASPGGTTTSIFARLALGFAAPWQCLRALRPTLPVASSDITLCGACQRQPPAIDATIALYLYQHPIDHFIHQLKFHGRLAHAWLLGCLLTKHLAARLSLLPDCIVPVPLHPHRIRARGFNQALELARQIGRRLQVPVDYRTMRRNR
ncbi:MAG TPA: ComF family protein, partial [Gammaproteobacteria bacterium]|nr:ComF family protein [Gammaproteobacteria bacterium]